ncbi:hypothetical protein [Mucilaginibacter jinjuensis]|uniref:Uncharacterized protein n=1 Tax=Mucilaginibacter jinjuensis TaxID=1176721 RepID=A0ABY7T7P4_9SPHI|nr:hypothetical protein [Mucilaginibacter jinjuensis]WCT11871.1 hypothetical protein PQO05_24365 [Mucilaginibacter jinjuensis]
MINNEWLNELRQIVKNEPDRYAVHAKCKPLLEKMSISKEFLYDIIRQNLSTPEYLLRKRTYPTLSMVIEENNDFSFVVNIFPSLPDKKADVSFQSIHHHGSLLLSTVGAFGPGYQSILFKKGYSINKETGDAKMEIAKQYQNKIGVVEFVDCYQPHIVFYPVDITATYAFWCDDKKKAKEAIKKIGLLKRIRKPAAKLINSLGLSKILGLNKIEYFDFYVDQNKVIALKDRLAYDVVGSNDNFLKNIFFFIQQTGFADKDFLAQLSQAEHVPAGARIYIDKLIKGERIEDEFFSGHLDIPKVNLKQQDVLKAVANNQV